MLRQQPDGPIDRRRRGAAAGAVGALGAWLLLLLGTAVALAQPASVHPGINRHFLNPDVRTWVERFESEGREVYDQREAIVAALGVRAGMAIADVGAGTGLFTRLFVEAVGPRGRVVAVDIAPSFVESIRRYARTRGLEHLSAHVGSATDPKLASGSFDLVFTSDTYHHFEFPEPMLAAIRAALRPGGRFVVIDFERIPGVSSSFILGHVRAGRETVRSEIEAAGFRLLEDRRGLLRENYFLVFARSD